MLDAYIIDSIRREQEEREFERARIQLELPVYREPIPLDAPEPSADEEEWDGPIIIPFNNPQDGPEEDAA